MCIRDSRVSGLVGNLDGDRLGPAVRRGNLAVQQGGAARGGAFVLVAVQEAGQDALVLLERCLLYTSRCV